MGKTSRNQRRAVQRAIRAGKLVDLADGEGVGVLDTLADYAEIRKQLIELGDPAAVLVALETFDPLVLRGLVLESVYREFPILNGWPDASSTHMKGSP
jgi:hypothetical protein